MRVSVVIPCYRTSGTLQTLHDAVASVMRQSVAVDEIIVVDDGSTPTVSQTTCGVEDSRLEIIRHDVQRGASAARNTGIDRASGDVIAFLDADDVWRPDKVARQLEMFDPAHDGNMFVASNCNLGPDEQAPVHNAAPPRPGEPLARYFLVDHCAFQTSTLMVSAALAKRVQFTPGLRRHQDWDFVLRLEALGAHYAYTHEPLSVYNNDKRLRRISNQARAFEPTVEWFRLRRDALSVGDMQYYFVNQCLSRRSLQTPAAFFRSFVEVAAFSPTGMTAALFQRAYRVLGRAAP